MPKDLPGFYWDDSRNRYFPLSSKPKQPAPPAETISSTHRKDLKNLAKSEASSSSTKEKTHQHPRRGLIPFHNTASILSTKCYTKRLRDAHEILLYHYGSSSRMSHVSVQISGNIQSFCSRQLDGRSWRFIGDDSGWLYSDKNFSLEDRHGMAYWSADLNLQPSCSISSICASDYYCVSTCLGPGKISLQDLKHPERMFILSLNAVHDIRASDLQGKRLVLGASKKAVYISDIDISNSPQYLQTKSDVFSVVQQENFVYTGSRNGTVERFDMRMPKHRGQKLFDTRFNTAPRSSVLHLSVISDSELLLSHLNGDLVSYDLRFSSTSEASPVKVFDGHVNTNTQNLGIAIDREHDILFAAGEDCRVRAWSLRNGVPLLPPPELLGNPLQALYPSTVPCLQVTEEPGQAGLSLWAACQQDLFQFHLGQRMVPET